MIPSEGESGETTSAVGLLATSRRPLPATEKVDRPCYRALRSHCFSHASCPVFRSVAPMVRGSRQIERGHISPAVAESPLIDRPRSAVTSAVSLRCRCSLSASPDANVGMVTVSEMIVSRHHGIRKSFESFCETGMRDEERAKPRPAAVAKHLPERSWKGRQTTLSMKTSPSPELVLETRNAVESARKRGYQDVRDLMRDKAFRCRECCAARMLRVGIRQPPLDAWPTPKAVITSRVGHDHGAPCRRGGVSDHSQLLG